MLSIPAPLRRAGVWLLPVLVGLTGAWAGVRLWGSDDVRMGPFSVGLSAAPGPGRTVISLPPLGDVRLDTHASPVSVRASLTGVDLNGITDTLRSGSTRDVVREVEADARRHLVRYAGRVVGAATVGALVTGAVVFRRRRPVLVSAATALAVTAGTVGGAYQGFRPQAFAEPSFSGTLALAPQIVGPVSELSDRLDEFRANLERIVGGAIRAYTVLEPSAVGGRGEIRVLHVSDIHLNTLGIDFAVEVARGFDVSFVIDTGDITSYGTPPEEEIASQIPRFGRPYVFVRGNHDPPAVVDRLRTIPDVHVLDGNTVTLDSLTVYGLGHPVYTENSTEEVDHPTYVERTIEAGARIRADLRAMDRAPNIVAVHDDRMTEAAGGDVALVVSGHRHRAAAYFGEDTFFLRAGSTGGAGVNMFRAREGVPLSANILYFDRATLELAAYDVIEQSPGTGRLSVQRRLVSEAPRVSSTRTTPSVPPSPER